MCIHLPNPSQTLHRTDTLGGSPVVSRELGEETAIEGQRSATAPDRPSGYSIFESMNDRGARLTPVDLLKSHLMSKVGDAENEATELNGRWRSMLAELTAAGNDDLDTPRAFLKAALLAR